MKNNLILIFFAAVLIPGFSRPLLAQALLPAPAMSSAQDNPDLKFEALPEGLSPAQLVRFDEVARFVEENYVDPVRRGQLLAGARQGMESLIGPFSREYLFYGAMHGMFKDLGRYSQFYTPEEYKAFRAVYQGAYAGIGIMDGDKAPGQAVPVDVVLPGSPAEQAGLRSGDRIVEINGVDARSLTREECNKKLVDPKNSQVILKFLRGTSPDALTTTITRAYIQIPNSVSKMLPGNQGYVYFNSFRWKDASDNTALEVLDRVRDLVHQEPGASAIILDIRNNSGGDLRAAAALAAAFLHQGQVIVTLKGRQEEKRFGVPQTGEFAEIPLKLLVNGHSASASEILAGALQDYKRAVVYGQQSYGKGSAQYVPPMAADGTSLKLTMQRWYTPNGRSIDRGSDGKGGVTPDVTVPVSDAVETKALRNITKELFKVSVTESAPDPVLEEALK